MVNTMKHLPEAVPAKSKDPTENYQDFIRGEVRYASLAKLFPAKAEEAYKINEEDAKRRLETYKKLAAE